MKGVPSLYKNFVTVQKKVSTLERQDIFCFGHVLFEMIVGYPMRSAVVDTLPSVPYGGE